MAGRDCSRIKVIRRKIFVIVGATASGKSELAVRLAKKFKGEIVSFDAMQIYRGAPILTNQPSVKERKGIRHHLLGFLPLSKEFSAAQFSQKAEKIIGEILRREKTPVLVGGSGFYLKALLEGYHAPVAANRAIRKKYQKLFQEKGSAFLYEKLRTIDRLRAKKIHPNDIYRLIRALEIYEVTGRKPSEFGKREESPLASSYTIQKIGLRLPWKILYEKIDRRVEEMVKRGALREVGRLLKKRLSPTAKKMIGFSEFSGYLKGNRSLEEAVSNIQRATRHYAKRQETWFRREEEVRWIEQSSLTKFLHSL